MTIDQNHSDDGGHRFSTVSTHPTSQGLIAYRRCTCNLWRIERYQADGRRQLEAVVDQLSRPGRSGAGAPWRAPAVATECKA